MGALLNFLWWVGWGATFCLWTGFCMVLTATGWKWLFSLVGLH